jgi:hypothetical protein
MRGSCCTLRLRSDGVRREAAVTKLLQHLCFYVTNISAPVMGLHTRLRPAPSEECAIPLPENDAGRARIPDYSIADTIPVP